MRRVPIVPTLLVTLAVAAMIALGLWQLLIRLPEKEAALAQLAANPAKPPIAFPAMPDDGLLFRRSRVMCRAPVIHLAGAGAAGFRAIADCRPDAPGPDAPGSSAHGPNANGPAIAVQLGTTRDPKARPAWSGGEVNGYLSHVPDSRPLIAGLWNHRPKPMMLIADTPPAGLARNTPPDLSAVPNSHLAYAGQWFFFAAIASVIYALALRRRSPAPSPRP